MRGRLASRTDPTREESRREVVEVELGRQGTGAQGGWKGRVLAAHRRAPCFYAKYCSWPKRLPAQERLSGADRKSVV